MLMMIWIFLGVVIATSMFLMVMYANKRDQLRNQFLGINTLTTTEESSNDKQLESNETLDEKLLTLAGQLTEKEKMLKSSINRITNIEQKLIEPQEKLDQDTEYQYRHKKILEDLNMELQITEVECKNLTEQIQIIAQRREDLKKEVTKHQNQLNITVNNFVRDLGSKREDAAGSRKVSETWGSIGTTGMQPYFGNLERTLPRSK